MPSRRLIVVLAVLVVGTFSLGLGAALDRRADNDRARTVNEPGLQPTDSPTPEVPSDPSDTPTPEPTDSPSDLPSETPSETPTDTPTDTPTSVPSPDITVIAEPPVPQMPNTGADPLTGLFALALVGTAVVVRRVHTVL